MIVGRLLERAEQRSHELERRTFYGPWGEPLDGTIPAPSEADGLATTGGILVNDRTAMRLTAVYSCVSLIAETVGGLPLGAFRRQGDTRRPVDPEPSLLVEPHPEMDRPDWVARLLASLLLRGNAYGLISDVDRFGWPTAILPLDPRDVQVRRDKTRGGVITYKAGGDVELAYPAGRMWHVRGLTLPGDITGCSPISYARQSIAATLAAEEFGARFFMDGATPSGVLTTDKEFKGDAGERRAKKILAGFIKAVGGGRRRRPVLLSDGVKYEQVSLSPNDAQFLETRELGALQIAQLYRVPPHKIAIVDKSTSWGSGIEQQSIEFVQTTLSPWIIRLEFGLSRLLPRPQRARFNVAGLLRGDLKARYEAYAHGRQWGWLSVNDILELEDRPPIDGGDVYLQPANMINAGTQVIRVRDAEGREYDLTPAPLRDTRGALLAQMAEIEERIGA